MITLTIGNSLSQVQNMTREDFKSLRTLLSYTPAGSNFTGGSRYSKRYLIDNKGVFLTGLLYIVEDYLKDKDFKAVDNRHPPISAKSPSERFLPGRIPFPYPEQVEAAKSALKAHRGIISAVTGFGKSLVIGMLINEIRVPTLVIVPNLAIKSQLEASLQYWFGELTDVRVETVHALDPNKPETAQMVIIDEFHHAGAKTYRKLNQKAWNSVYYRFGLTATPFRSDETEKLLLESVLAEVIYRVDYKTSVDKGYIVPVEAYYYDLPVTHMKGNERNWAHVYSELVVNNEFRNLLIVHLMDKLKEHSTLCLVKELAHGDNLCYHSNVEFANGESDNTRELLLEFNLRERSQLIGTTGVLGEGVDTKPAEYIILAGGGKSKNQLLQQIGRGIRKYKSKNSCKIILFRDKSNKYLLNHFNANVKTIKEYYGITPIKLELPDII